MGHRPVWKQWEQEASLRLRRGDVSALETYDDHGRIRGGEPEQAMEEARRLCVADYVTGKDADRMSLDPPSAAGLDGRASMTE